MTLIFGTIVEIKRMLVVNYIFFKCYIVGIVPIDLADVVDLIEPFPLALLRELVRLDRSVVPFAKTATEDFVRGSVVQ